MGLGSPTAVVPEASALAYAFEYDPLNRLKKSEHFRNIGTWVTSTSFHENIELYDLNGNIKELKRTGKGGNNMDLLDYTYDGNRLMKVVDNGNDGEGFRDGNASGDDYIYDDNGNMVTDRNKEISTIEYNHLNLPFKVIKETGDYVKYIYNAAGVKLSQEVYDGSNVLKKKTDYLGEFFYENDTLKFVNHEEGRIVMTGSTPEYQYTLKDHLGNTRITFTTEQKVESFVASMNVDNQVYEENIFGAYNSFTNGPLDPTPSASENDKILILNGGYNGQVGLTKSLAVVPGDVIALSVYAKVGESGGTSNLMNFAAALTQAFGLSPSIPGEAATAFEALNSFGLDIANGGRDDDEDEPKGFLNIIVFDQDYNFVTAAFRQVTEADLPSDTISLRLKIRQPGYAFVFLSNESEVPQEIGFDNFVVTQHHSDVIQQDDYYPFGLAFNSYARENSTPNKYKFGGKEEQTDLALNTIDWGWRQYDPAIGRWNVIDQWAEKYNTTSPYAFVQNNPILNREIDGRWFDEKNEKKAAKIERKAEKRADKLEAKAAKIEARGGDSGDRRASAGELRQSGQDVRDMRGNATTEFRYAKASDQSNPAGTGNPTTERTGTNQITMFTEKNMGSKLHEGRHGGQEARGELGNNYQNYGVQDEVSAYRAQYSWSGKMNYVPQTDFSNPANLIRLTGGVQAFQQTITNINQINPALVNTLVDNPGLNQQLIYPPQGISIQQWNGN